METGQNIKSFKLDIIIACSITNSPHFEQLIYIMQKSRGYLGNSLLPSARFHQRDLKSLSLSLTHHSSLCAFGLIP